MELEALQWHLSANHWPSAIWALRPCHEAVLHLEAGDVNAIVIWQDQEFHVWQLADQFNLWDWYSDDLD